MQKIMHNDYAYFMQIEKENSPPHPPYKEKDKKIKILSLTARVRARKKIIFGFVVVKPKGVGSRA